MSRYADTFASAFSGYARWVWSDVTQPGAHSYFTALVVITGALLVGEFVAPWRRQQFLREGFGLDAFYLLFNFYVFGLLGFQALAATAHAGFADMLARMGLADRALLDLAGLPSAAQLGIYLMLRDFIQYWVHRLLHAVPALWRFHRVHHSVREMGVAANLRFHPMESVLYRAMEAVPMAWVGFGLTDMFAVHVFSLLVGHWNHANIKLPLGPLRYLLNGPQMHIFHHAEVMPFSRGANFGVVLSVWDWLFGTAWVPDDGRGHALGFDGVARYPRSFLAQLAEPFRSTRAEAASRS
jgi:sterol desaturase/sphingolipid hydroxylase (fatty acid hydroxylase superfamily)